MTHLTPSTDHPATPLASLLFRNTFARLLPLCIVLAIGAALTPATASAQQADGSAVDPLEALEPAEPGAPAGSVTAPVTALPTKQVGAYEAPPGLADRFDQGLGMINGAIVNALFFDVLFGAAQSPKLDDQGNPVLASDPVMVDVASAESALLVDENGEPVLDDAGNPTVVAMLPGGKFQPVTTDGLPQTTPGDPVMDGPVAPFLVVWLGFGAIYFTLFHRLLIWRLFGHAIAIVRGKYDSGQDTGDIPPFRALTSALSATVGLGNIAGVAVAMVVGGPGALFWMMFLGFFGMASKFHESTLSQAFRVTNTDGTMSGGPMYTLDHGFKKHLPRFWFVGKILAIIFAVFTILASLGGGNMFQSNQAFEGFFSVFVAPNVVMDAPALALLEDNLAIGFGLTMAVLVGVVVLGGITRIGAATSRLVPAMAVIYCVACLAIIGVNISELPSLILLILQDAFGADAAFGGLIGAMMVGFQRAAFSSEAGMGSSAIAHAAAKTSEPVREGLVASLEPFIDTVVICFMTGLVVLITGAYLDAEGGAAVTLYAFKKASVFAGVFPYILSVSIILFAFSTMISWCYYGERATNYLFGEKTVVGFRVVFIICVFVGAVAGLDAVILFSDLSLLSMGLPNILGGIILAPVAAKLLNDYLQRKKSGNFTEPHTRDEAESTESAGVSSRSSRYHRHP